MDISKISGVGEYSLLTQYVVTVYKKFISLLRFVFSVK